MEEKIKCPTEKCESKEFILMQEGKITMVDETGNVVNKDYVYRCTSCYREFKSKIGPQNPTKKILHG